MDRAPPRWLRPAAVLAAAALSVSLISWSFGWLPDAGPASVTPADVDRAVRSGIDAARQKDRDTPPDAATAYRTALPSIVTITTEEAAGSSGLGTGFIINDRGAVLTALHVVENGKRIQVRFADGTRATATVTTKQPATDIAVLTVDRLPGVVVPAIMGGLPAVGDAVFPVGNPLGLTGSLTAGVVSALDRSVRVVDGRTLRRLIQFDAAVNPGNSGGPLLNRDGQVVGVVTGTANPTGQSYFIGIGFAVPIATAADAAGRPPQ